MGIIFWDAAPTIIKSSTYCLPCVIVFDEFYFSHCWRAGFKATLNYEKCLEERNATLYAMSVAGHVDMSADGVTVVPGSSDFLPTTVLPLPVCDLEKELDSVGDILLFN